ncbi:autotransporter outer membrane beta-barrel domain-containing protein [Bartonella sp. 1-1C]|uniref:autotransporter outer membrane beta-barrel domain-containing protein n=1 Tax=Bartonella sp. 1-1C TaxID=515256 RepID=UPI0001F4BE94|nr:autotransporter outer membrane beta-barrel domain-containing protein [Bartonella sp. 1-1C]ATO57621.1 outer membrane autotransporter barrel domain-containing protein [Bartonella sp. 1-1C]CBI80620.1 putative Inducible Bartonella autotransporter C protein [Bartonella sp. 1-1C]
MQRALYTVFTSLSLLLSNLLYVLAEVNNSSSVANKYPGVPSIAIEKSGEPVVINGGTFKAVSVGILANGTRAFSATGIDVQAGLAGIMPAGATRMYLKDSVIRIKSPDGQISNGYGVVFGYDNFKNSKSTSTDASSRANISVVAPSFVELTNTKILSSNLGIVAFESGIVSLKNSEIHSNILLGSYGVESVRSLPVVNMLRVSASHSILEGSAQATGMQYSFLTLKDDSKWIIPVNLGVGEEQLRAKQRQESVLHMLTLNNSAVVFDQKDSGIYQTLRVRPLKSSDTGHYLAVGNANIHFNMGVNGSDKLIIETDVGGITKVHINYVEDHNVEESRNATRVTRNAVVLPRGGVTVIEVHNRSVSEKSFQLAHGYTVFNSLPYRYVLNSKRETSGIWKFNLSNGYVDAQSQVKALVPQMASYVVMPNALFSAGFSDISNQNGILADVQETLNVAGKKTSSVFLSSYGNAKTFSSIRNPLQYGYGADIRYAALQTGAVLGSFENANTVTRVGMLGTYGQLSFTPKDMEDSAKSTLDKWSISVFGNMQHDNNSYMNALFSYGILKGHIKTAVVDNVAKLDDKKMLSVSATVGHKLATGNKSVSFEPQAQIVYQRLMFDTILDSDNLEVNMKDPHQWLMRVGGRLTKMLPVVEKNSFIAFYGKMNVIKTLSFSDTIEVGDTFYLDSMGSAIEGGLGVNVQLTNNIFVHGDASYQQRLSKTGMSGASFSGKLQYRF